MWRPLSVRTGKAEVDGPFEGVPAHLAAPLVEWVRDEFVAVYGMENASLLQHLAVLLRVPKQPGGSVSDLLDQMLNQALRDPDFCLDLVDSLLTFGRLHPERIRALETMLLVGGSVWTVGVDHKSLTRVVDESARAQVEATLTSNDRASSELAEAWSNAFGRSPNASDAWDHAIKAVEEALKPVVTPNNPSATLGHILGQLRSQPNQHQSVLRDNAPSPTVAAIPAIEQILHLIWPNPDRHGGAGTRVPSLTEARAVVQLAVTVVQWARIGVVS